MNREVKKYPLFKVHVNAPRALAAITDVFASGFINEGTQVAQLTEKLSERFETDRLALLNSCTSALSLALRLCEVSTGHDVISTPMTCIATNTPIVHTGAKLVWCDIDPESGMMDIHDLKKKITLSTRAVMTVAWAGVPPNLKEIYALCQSRGIPLILDAAHAFDAMIGDKFIHEFADYTCYSFQAIKHFTTGDGGALICKSQESFERAKALKWFGFNRDAVKDKEGNWKGQQWDADVVEAGFKYNMNNVSAAIGLSQLISIDDVLDVHRSNANHYDDLFANFKHITPIKKPENSLPSHWVYTVRTDPQKRDELLKYLNLQGVMAGLVHIPNDEYTCFASSRAVLPGVRQFSREQFSLPCGWWLGPDDIIDIAKIVKQFWNE